MSTTKERMVDSAIGLLRERGVHGVTIDAVLADSGAPRGSVYHHFPAGRQELVATAAAQAADFMDGYIARLAEDSPEHALSQFLELWTTMLEQSDFRAGCPIAAIASTSEDDQARSRADTSFHTWRQALTTSLTRHGVTAADAQGYAALTVAAVEGAIIMSRANRSIEPLQIVAATLAAHIPTPEA